jgi:hypothetical protein
MAAKKKNKKKSTKSKKSAGRKSAPAKKLVQKQKTPKKSVKRAAAPNKAAAKRKRLKKTTSGKTASARYKLRNKNSGKKNQEREVLGFPRDTSGSPPGGESGDLQGLSNVASADSESVDELLEEGNAFEAGVISGVERAGEREGREVRTREVPEDDVPGEYLDEE